MSIEELVLLIIAIVLVTLILYVGGGMVGRDWSATGSYALRLLVVAIIAVFVIPVFRSAAGEFHLGDLGLLLAFVILVIAIRFIIVDELTVSDEWLAAIVIALIAAILIYFVDWVADEVFDVRLLALF